MFPMCSISFCCFVYGKYRSVDEVLMVLYGFVRGVFIMVFKSASHKLGMLDMQRMRFGTYFPYTLHLRAVNFRWIVRWSCVAQLNT